MNEENEAADPATPYRELLDICASLARTVHDQGARAIEQQAHLDALGVMVHMLARRTGLSADASGSLQERLRAAFYQQRLEALENENPAAAASADLRPGLPDLDPDLLDILRHASEENEDRE